MHSHDLDLIAAHADGSAPDDTEARALIETCSECRAEYEAQRSVLSALGTMPPVSPMTDVEKAALHRDLWTELRNPPQAARAASPGWMRWALAAAGLFVLVGVAGVLGQLGQGDSAGPEAVAFADTTTTAEAAADRGLEEPLAPQGGEDGSATTAAGDGAEDNFSETTMAAAETTATTPTDADFEVVASQARRAALAQSTTTTTVVAPEVDRCQDDERLGGQELLATVDLDRTYLIMVPAGVEITEETPITFVDAETCDVVHVVE